MPNRNLIVSVLSALLVGLILGALLGGPYEFVRTPGPAVWRLNRITGAAAICAPHPMGVGCAGQMGPLPPLLGGN